jgi:hypothetical protein
LRGWTTKPIKASWEVEWSKSKGTRETRSRMWMSSTNNDKKHKGKVRKEDCKTKK